MNIAIFVSGNGSNLQAIIDSVSKNEIKARLVLAVSDKKEAYALKRAEKAGIETFVLDPGGFNAREDYDREIVKELKKRKVELVVLAGFMRLLSPYFVKEYKNKIMNIHPALLPLFKGTHGIRDAFEAGVKKTGVTVHFVDKKLDHGPVILQESLEIGKKDTLESLEKKIHALEHRMYPKAVKLFVEGKIEIKGQKIKISA
ncbi:MAG: phosphoribosylglycinamide formyltransferase [Candidatus Omnitrophica bacterium]|nr:phosphoribosylglycinamide formyltransferase [Candidatus Omnitrophota bacterium]